MLAKHSIKIYGEVCKGCELCIDACPKDVLSIDGQEANTKGYYPAAVVNIEECIGCSNCAIMCPEGAIRIYAMEEK